MTTSKTEERLGYIKRSRTHFPWNFNAEISQPRRAALSNLGIKQDQVKKVNMQLSGQRLEAGKENQYFAGLVMSTWVCSPGCIFRTTTASPYALVHSVLQLITRLFGSSFTQWKHTDIKQAYLFRCLIKHTHDIIWTQITMQQLKSTEAD